MKKNVLLLLILIGAQPVFGQVIFSANPASQTVNLGSTFTVTFSATTTVPFTGFSLYLGTSAADANLFTVTAASLNSQFEYISGPPSLPASLSTAGTPDFGSTVTPTFTDLPAGAYTLTTLTIRAENGLLLGGHILTILPTSTVYDSNFNNYYPSGPVTFNVTAVPEPNTASLLLAGLLGGFLLLSPRIRRVLHFSGRLPQRISAAHS